MALPNVLIIGAMKAGTTTLWRDLLPHPEICFPRLRKEPQLLARTRMRPREIRRRYEWFFAHARGHRVICDPSMRYAAMPKFSGVATKARRVLGDDLKIIYMVREPIARAVSHHHHGAADGWLPQSIDTAIQRNPQLTSISRYAYQLDPWLEQFGPERIKVIHLESYAAARHAGLADACDFLGLDPAPALASLRPDAVYNRGEQRRAHRGPGMVILGSRPYRRLRPRMPVVWDRRLRQLLLPPVPPRPAPPAPETVRTLVEHVAEDVERISRFVGADRPLWDMEAAAASWIARHRAWAGEAATPGEPAAT